MSPTDDLVGWERGDLRKIKDLGGGERGRYAVTASNSLPPTASGANMDGWSHFSRTKTEPRFVPWWAR